MNPTYTHNLHNSLNLWFDNYLCKHSEAYKTFTTKLYNYSDDRLGGSKVIYGSPYKQWIYDKSLTGATIPSGLTIDGNFTPTGTSGMKFDFDNGRVLFNSGVSTSLNITGTYTVKDFNIYSTDKSEEELIIETKFINNSRFTLTESYIDPYHPVTPSIFLSAETVKNQGFALGGQDETTIKGKAVIFADNLYQLDGALSICADSFERCFSLIPMQKHPLDEFRSVKTGLYPTGYSYNELSNSYSNNKVYITEVDTSKMRDNDSKELNPSVYIGFVDFLLANVRYPRS
jgi:hypothetical protein